jgi:hypothetical protein
MNTSVLIESYLSNKKAKSQRPTAKGPKPSFPPYNFFKCNVPLKDATEIIASPDPCMAATRRSE